MAKFPETFCSSCGGEFGPGDSGFSHCDQHKGTVTESIYSGSVIVPLADVQHIEPWPKNSVPGFFVVTKHTRWDSEHDQWANAIWISDPETAEFKRAWCRYRSELEADTLAGLSHMPSERENR